MLGVPCTVRTHAETYVKPHARKQSAWAVMTRRHWPTVQQSSEVRHTVDVNVRWWPRPCGGPDVLRARRFGLIQPEEVEQSNVEQPE